MAFGQGSDDESSDPESGGDEQESAMRIAAEIGMSIYFSEYPSFSDGLEDETEKPDAK